MTEMYTPDLFKSSRKIRCYKSFDEMESFFTANDFPVDHSKRLGYVYAVQCCGGLKIGFTNNIWKRLHEIERMSRIYGQGHSTLGSIAFTAKRTEHYRTLEHHLHCRFFNRRLSHLGELFDLSFDLAVEGLRTEPEKPFLIEQPHPAPRGSRKKHAQNPRGSAARLRNTLAALYSPSASEAERTAAVEGLPS